MRDPFAAALAVLHSAAGSVAAVYTPPSGVPVPLRVIREQGEREAGSGYGRVLIDANAVQIQRSDVAQPIVGAGLAIGTELFTIQGGAKLDSEGLTWTCTLDPA